MVFLGGAVLANLVRPNYFFLRNPSQRKAIYLHVIRLPTRTTCGYPNRSGRNRARVLWQNLVRGKSNVLRRLFYGLLSLLFFRLVLLRTLPHYLQAVLPCFFHDPLCRYPSHFVPYLIASSILCLDWSGAGGLGPLK